MRDRHCDGCIYYRKMQCGVWYCGYIFIRGKRRPCKPGKGCTVKIVLKKKRKEDKP